MLATSTIDQVRAYPDIVAIITDYVTLKKRGRNFIGLCPFHSERTPSFTVSPDKQIWHCFGCHESGDHIGFVMKIDHLSFAEAVTQIAEKVGIRVEHAERSAEQNAKDLDRKWRLDVLYEARTYFEQHLAGEASAYLTKRGLHVATLQLFHLGYCPQGSGLKDYLSQKGFSAEMLAKSGVFSGSSSELYPTFRNRVIFPILDHHGRTVGFGGRSLGNQEPKYLNSEESDLFSKRKQLFALDQAKKAIKSNGFAIVMEGYMDVVMAHQYGFTHAVATLGTAITSEHAHLLKRFTTRVILAMDSDTAGQQAVDRSFEVLRPFDIKVDVLQLSQKDPADFLVMQGAEAFQAELDRAIPVLEFKIQRVLNQAKGQRIEEVPRVLDGLMTLLRFEQDAVVQNHYLKLISKTLSVPLELVVAKLKNTGYNPRKFQQNSIQVPKNNKNKVIKAQEQLLYIMATSLDNREKILARVAAHHFTDDTFSRLATYISGSKNVNKDIVLGISEEPLQQALSRILLEGEDQVQDAGIWEGCVDTLLNFHHEKDIQQLKVQLREAELSGNDAEGNRLLNEIRQRIKCD